MKWLRERPERWEELDLVDGKGRWKDGVGERGVGDEDENMVEPRKRALFDEEDEVEDEEQEEEEEEPPTKTQVKVPLPPPMLTATTITTAHPPTPRKGVAPSPRGLRR